MQTTALIFCAHTARQNTERAHICLLVYMIPSSLCCSIFLDNIQANSAEEHKLPPFLPPPERRPVNKRLEGRWQSVHAEGLGRAWAS